MPLGQVAVYYYRIEAHRAPRPGLFITSPDPIGSIPLADENQQSNKIDDHILISQIGTGKTCQVYEVMHEQSSAMLAMKLMNPEAMADSEEKSLLKHEGKVAQQLEHPNLIRCSGIVMRKTECYLLLDLFKTPNLKVMLRNDPAAVQSRMKKLIEGVCAGLQHMHDKGWVHMDLKPDNILMNRSAEVRIIDFSLAVRKATALSKVFASKKGVIRGTRTYIAPETIRKKPSTPATDIYSLGIIFYECLTGKPPFSGESPQDLLKRHIADAPVEPSLINSNVTPEMDALILKMLAKKPKDRFQECSEIVSEVARIKIFKEEPEQALAQKENGEQVSDGDVAKLEELLDNKLDSRADDKIQAMLRGNPAMQKAFEEIKQRQAAKAAAREEEQERRRQAILSKKTLAEKKVEKKAGNGKKKPRPKPTAAPPQPQAAPPQPMPGYYPQGAPQPGYPQAMPPQPYAVPPQPGYPPQPMPGYPPVPNAGYPQQPGMPQQPAMPQPGMTAPGYGQVPGQPLPPGVDPIQMPPGQVPPQPAPPAQQVPGQAAQSQPAKPPQKDEDGMEFMMDLPDVE